MIDGAVTTTSIIAACCQRYLSYIVAAPVVIYAEHTSLITRFGIVSVSVWNIEISITLRYYLLSKLILPLFINYISSIDIL